MPAEDRLPVYESGAWELDLARRELRSKGQYVPLGGRAFEIIEVLVRSAGELVTKDDLMDRIWPGAAIEENRLQVHISALRKALGADRGLLKTASGRGYRLLGSWTIRQGNRPAGRDDPEPVRAQVLSGQTNLPAAVSELIGRAGAVQDLHDLLSTYREVTLTGPGGIGKTALALGAARGLLPAFDGDGWFVQLASLSDPALVPTAVARVIGLKLGDDEISAPAVARAIGTRKLLLVVDNCEHLVDAAAELAETIVRMCPHASVLVTSREILRIEGEYVYRVPPLNVPPADQENPDGALQHSAVQLFVARTQALNADFSLRGDDLAEVAEICRHLDGIPLAIEFAAARAAVLGLREVASRLGDRFRLLTGGRRTALPRHQTLRAALDWSYDLLPESEQRLLRRLAIFSAGFALDAATAIMGDTGTLPDVAEGIANLVAKSLLTRDASVSGGRWLMLETIRAYALEQLGACGETSAVGRRHAEFFRDLLAPGTAGRPSQPTIDDLPRFVAEIDNVRSALDWAFSPAGDPSIGVALTAGYAPVWVRLSLIVECRGRVERALSSLEEQSGLDARLRVLLTLALGAALYHATGTLHSTGAVLSRGLDLADSLDDEAAQLRALWAMWSYHYNKGEMRAAQPLARRYAGIAERFGDPADMLVGDRLMGTTLHHLGDHAAARAHLERVRDRYVAPRNQRHTIWLHYDQSVLARSILARVYCLQGFADRARATAQACIDDAQATDHKLSQCYALNMAAGPIALLTGDLLLARKTVANLNEIVTAHSVMFWKSLASCLEAQLLIRTGDFSNGSVVLRGTLEACDRIGGTTFHAEFQGTLAEGLGGLGHITEALAMADLALATAERNGEHWCVPELLRIKAELLLGGATDRSSPAAESCFKQALALARQQGALLWELRCALSIAGLRIRQDRAAEARQTLAPVYARFTEGFETADLRAAKAMLASL